MNEKVSVVIPVYNIEKYIKKCIDTVVEQTYSNLEIILVDDGSTDKSGEICEQCAQKDFRIKVIHKENGGAADARNVGIKNTTGKWITFVDGDDYISKELIEQLMLITLKNNADVVITNLIKVNEFEERITIKNESNKEEELTSEQAIEEMLYQKKFDSGLPAKIFAKKLFEDIILPVGNLYEDIAILPSIFNKANKIVYSDFIGYMYFFRDTGTTRSDFKKEKMILIDVCLDIKRFVKNKYPKIEKAAQYRLLNSAIHLLMQIDRNKKETQEIQNKLWQIIKKNRIPVLFNKKVRVKTKLAIILSFLGERALKRIFEQTNNLSRKRI